MPIDYGAIRNTGRAAEQSWADSLKNNPLLDQTGMAQIVAKNTSGGANPVFNEKGWGNDVTTALLSTAQNPSGRMLQWIASMVPNIRNRQKVDALSGTGAATAAGQPAGGTSMEPGDFISYLANAIHGSTSGMLPGGDTASKFQQAISRLRGLGPSSNADNTPGFGLAHTMTSTEMDDLLSWAMSQASPYLYSRAAPGMQTALEAAHLTSPTYDNGLAGWLEAYDKQFKPAGYGL